MQFIDDRTEEQKRTHNVLITATDTFMSGWGHAKGGKSKCAWACTPDHWEKVYNWVESRPEMKYVNVTTKQWRPRNAKHVHIYVVGENHPSLK